MGFLRLRLSPLWIVVGMIFVGGTAIASPSQRTESHLAEASAPQPQPEPEAASRSRAPATVDGAHGGTGTPGAGPHENRSPRRASPESLILLRSAGATLRPTF